LNQNPNELNWIIDFERSIRMRAWPLGRLSDQGQVRRAHCLR
jgi:hypothetical protein